MPRRWTLLAGAIALTLATPQVASATPQQPPPVSSSAPGPDAATAAALHELRSKAEGAVRVQRDSEGDVALVSSTDGQAMLDGDAATPRRAAQEQLARYGKAFGIDGTTSRAVVTQTLDSATGGSVVRAQQVVDGVPVFGGQVVMSLDADQGVVSVGSATTDATQVPAAVVSESDAGRTARGFVARSTHTRAQDLEVLAQGRHLYDPALVHSADPRGVRPVWQFRVTNGSDIRETVLVGTDRGEIALHFNDAPALDRRICDNLGVRNLATTSEDQVPICPVAARTEKGPASLVADVNSAFGNLGEAAQAYSDLDGLDLTDLIGTTDSGSKTLQSTVRWCYAGGDTSCPYDNAFWDGRQMVFGDGYAAADDVVGHELTHGYVERTSGLFYLHQSGAINESVADTIGEIVDHRNGSDDDSGWTLGEQSPVGALRSMKDPPLFRQPDKMSSSLYKSDTFLTDNGDVHTNDGVGNKTAYLISQGGTFNGHTITGIDGGDPGLAKTGRLYLETIPRLTSGAQYADLGRTLVSTCDELAAAGTGGFRAVDCDSVRDAVAATELDTVPAGAPAQASISCPAATSVHLLARDDDGIDGFRFSSGSPLWGRTDGAPWDTYASSGKQSLFARDPDPGANDDPASGVLTSASFTVPRTPGGTFLNFHQAYVLDYDNTSYYDGGQVLVQTLGNGAWTTVNGLPWVNGPTRHIVGSTGSGFTGFGGDSHGYGGSQVNLSSLAGRTVRFLFRIEGDAGYAYNGWWVDDVRLYTCEYASAPTVSVAAATTSARVAWTAPKFVGSSPVASYRISRSDGKVSTAPAGARSTTISGLRANAGVTVTVAAVTGDGHVGASSSVAIHATSAALRSSVARPRKNATFTLTATLTRRGTSARVAGARVTLQRRLRGRAAWRTLSSGTTSSAGIKAWRVRQPAVSYYRVVVGGVRTWLGTTSAARKIPLR